MKGIKLNLNQVKHNILEMIAETFTTG